MVNIDWTDRRIVIFCAFLIFTTFSFYAFKVPLTTSIWVSEFYKEVQKYPPGSNVLLETTYGPDMIGDCYPNFILGIKYAIRADWDLLVFSATAASDLIIRQIFTAIFGPDWATQPIYGVKWAYLGMWPGGQPMLLTICESGLRAYSKTDFKGTPLDDLPVAQGFDNAKTWDLVVGYGCGTGYTSMPITYLQFGVPFVEVDIQGGASMLASDFAVRNIKGMLPGIKAAAEFELLTGLDGGALKFVSASIAISVFAMIGITVSNIYYLVLSPKAKRGIIPSRMKEVG